MLQALAYLRDGDKNFLEKLFSVHYDALYRIALNILHDEALAEDVVINAMMSLFSLTAKLRAMDGEMRFAYIAKAVRRAAFKLYNARKLQNITELPISDIIFSLPTQEADPANILIKDDEFGKLRAAIASLPKRDRQLLYLKYAVGLSAKEIGALTNATAGAVQTRLSRARNKVVVRLKEGGLEDEGEEATGYPGAVEAGAVRE